MSQENIHKGHRQRLIEQAKEIGIECLSEIQQVELLLTYVIPRKDTNPIAHRLLKKFKSFSKICDAPVDELVSVEGISNRAANLIKFIPEFFNFYRISKSSTKDLVFSSKIHMQHYLLNFMQFKPKEELYAVAIDQNMKLLGIEKLARGTEQQVALPRQSLLSFVAKHNTICYVCLAHNHPDCSCKPSMSDVNLTEYLLKALAVFNITLFEHIIVGNDGVYRLGDTPRFQSLLNQFRPVN